jgi:5-methylthioribose kinase
VQAQSELLRATTVVDYLIGRGLLPSGSEASVVELGGGVSNVVLGVAAGGSSRFVVKQALPQLRVADTWLATRERALSEAAALEVAARLTPHAVPRLLDADADAFALTIEWAPSHWGTWKDELLHGQADPEIAHRLGLILGRWHQETAAAGALDARFDDGEAFDQLRVDPYYRTAALRNPAVALRLEEYVERMTSTRRCLVHGDFSPKNVLVGEEVWVIDFEVAHRGDPAFDVAFLVNHLALKSIHRPAGAAAYRNCAEAFLGGYTSVVGPSFPGEPEYVLGHVGCLMLARVDGKSPAEYLDEAGRDAARRLALELLASPPARLATVWKRLEEVGP